MVPMQVIVDSSAREFLEKAGDLLYRNEAANSLLLGLCESAIRSPPQNSPLCLRLVADGETVAVAFQTPPHNLILSFASRDQLQLLAEFLAKANFKFPGVVGPANESEVFAMMWSQTQDCGFSLGMGQKIYQVHKVSCPTVTGNFRAAKADEVDLITNWLVEFGNEALPKIERKNYAERRPMAERAIANHSVYVWTLDSEPVAMAMTSRPTKNGISIAGVYTPALQRKKGFASVLVAHVSQKMLDSGKQFCVLYTDLANPTSNKIYQAVGYREVINSKHFIFFENASESGRTS